MRKEEIFELVKKERARQDIKFGDQSWHSFFECFVILGEDVGELARAILTLEYGEDNKDEVKRKLLQIITACFVILEQKF